MCHTKLTHFWEGMMRIVLVHPNYHSGGAEIAGNWPPAWVAYLSGHLKDAGFTTSPSSMR